jgi:hypothetical protein
MLIYFSSNKYYFPIIKSHQLMLFCKMTDVCCRKHRRDINVPYDNLQFLAGGHIIITGF